CPEDGDLLPADTAINLLKDSDGKVEYEIVVKNTGNVDLASPAVTDTMFASLGTPTQTGGSGSHTDNILQAGETWTYSGLLADWVKDGPTTNTAEVKAEYVNGQIDIPLDETDSASYTGIAPHITLSKLTNGVDGPSVITGQQITWSYTVTNDGNVDLTNIK